MGEKCHEIFSILIWGNVAPPVPAMANEYMQNLNTIYLSIATCSLFPTIVTPFSHLCHRQQRLVTYLFLFHICLKSY